MTRKNPTRANPSAQIANAVGAQLLHDGIPLIALLERCCQSQPADRANAVEVYYSMSEILATLGGDPREVGNALYHDIRNLNRLAMELLDPR
jgi:hypothetical protein